MQYVGLNMPPNQVKCTSCNSYVNRADLKGCHLATGSKACVEELCQMAVSPLSRTSPTRLENFFLSTSVSKQILPDMIKILTRSDVSYKENLASMYHFPKMKLPRCL